MKKQLFKSAILMALFFMVLPLMAQEEDEANVAGFRFLDYQNDFPEGLFSGKTAVLVSVLPKENTSLRGNWKQVSKEAHSVFKEAGIDAVGYYYQDDVMAGTEATAAYADRFKSRNIEYLLFLSEVMVSIKGREQTRYVVMITPFNGQGDLMSNGQKAWKAQSKSLDKTLRKVEKEAKRSNEPKENLLIIDVPEFFEPFNIIDGKRYKAYPANLKLDQLAVPRFEKHTIPNDRPGGMLNNRLAKELEEDNANIEKQNKDLARIFLEYPYKYGMVDDPQNVEMLKQSGYQYVLLRLHTTGENVRKMLGYEPSANEDYVTMKKQGSKFIMRSIPAKAPVYKYYAKQLYTGDVYVGSQWDADESWEEALQNFLNNLKKEIK